MSLVYFFACLVFNVSYHTATCNAFRLATAMLKVVCSQQAWVNNLSSFTKFEKMPPPSP